MLGQVAPGGGGGGGGGGAVNRKEESTHFLSLTLYNNYDHNHTSILTRDLTDTRQAKDEQVEHQFSFFSHLETHFNLCRAQVLFTLEREIKGWSWSLC